MRNPGKAALIILFVITAFAFAGSAQNATSVFVVYGTKFEPDGVTPEAVDYLVTVENVTKGIKTELILGESDGPGKYSAVWVQYMGDLAAEYDDQIMVKAEKAGYGVFGVIHTVSIGDVFAQKVMLDIYWEDIAVDNSTWGAIKSLYK